MSYIKNTTKLLHFIIHARTQIDEAITTICEYAYKHLQKINDKVPRYYTSLLIVQLSHSH